MVRRERPDQGTGCRWHPLTSSVPCTLGFRDLHRPSVTGLTGCLHLVVMIYFWDVEPEGGATAIVPGSHRYEDAARDHGFTQSRLEQDGIVVGAVPAGGAMLFDNRTYHTALPNTNGVDRRSLTIRYIPSWCRPLGAIANNAAALVRPPASDSSGCVFTPVAAFAGRSWEAGHALAPPAAGAGGGRQ